VKKKKSAAVFNPKHVRRTEDLESMIGSLRGVIVSYGKIAQAVPELGAAMFKMMGALGDILTACESVLKRRRAK